ncbi:MAG: hypothetical protein ACO31E_13020, partial [Phycisphaerales bacterium]
MAYAVPGIEFVRFDVPGLGSATVSDPVIHPDRRLHAYWIELASNEIDADRVAIEATIIPKVGAPDLRLPPMAVAKRAGRWDAAPFKDGWTALVPSFDSRLIYVSNDGDDAAAANVHG